MRLTLTVTVLTAEAWHTVPHASIDLLSCRRPMLFLLEVLGEHGRLVGVWAGVVERVAVLAGAAAGLSLAVVLEPDKRSAMVMH